MKKEILIYPIKSILSNDNLISQDSQLLLDSLIDLSNHAIVFKYIDDLKVVKDNQLLLILVQSGGSEGFFKELIYPIYKGPYYLLTYGSTNSLAASLEILSFLKQHQERSEVLHGDNHYILDRINYLYDNINQKKKEIRLGIFGKPSDWLISSDVDKLKCKKIFNIDLIDIDQDEIIQSIKSINEIDEEEVSIYPYKKEEVIKALKIYHGLKKVVEKYHLNGFTIRCFDIIKIIKSSACLALAVFNKDSLPASCEGDVPAMLTAVIIQELLNQHAFQVNPQWINPVNDEVEFAHCTLPLDMANSIQFDTHFESGIGIGLHGELKKGDVTIVKISNDLNEFYVEEGTLISNDYRKDRCRTQVKIKLNSSASYFLTSSLGNHHQIIYGHHKEGIKKYLLNLGLRNIGV